MWLQQSILCDKTSQHHLVMTRDLRGAFSVLYCPVTRPWEHAWGSEPRAITERVLVRCNSEVSDDVCAYPFLLKVRGVSSSSLLCITAFGLGVKFQ